MDSYYELTIPIYEQKMIVSIAATCKEAVEVINKTHNVEIDVKGARAYTVRIDHDVQEKYYFAMILTTKVTGDTLAHECVHMANNILEFVGVKTTYKKDEALAYLVSYLFEQIETLLKEHKKNGKSTSKNNT